VPHESVRRSERVACPICGRQLKWIPDRWLAAFECETCGQFSDFGGLARPSEPRHHSPQSPDRTPRQARSDGTPEQDDEKD